MLSQDLTSCGDGYFIDLSVGYTVTGQGLESCGCRADTNYCELVHIIMQEVRDDQTKLLSCPDISLTERWWRELKDLVDIYDPITCEEYPESETHPDRYEFNTSSLDPGDTLSILVCKTSSFDKNIIQLSASPGKECDEEACPPTISCPSEFKLRKGFDCAYSLPDFLPGILLTDECATPVIDVTSAYTIMQLPVAGTQITEDIFVEMRVYDEDGKLVTTCDIFVTLAGDPPPELDSPLPLPNIPYGANLPIFETLEAYDTIDDGRVIKINVETSIDPIIDKPCSGYTLTYRWTATDTCGNEATKIQSFDVLPDTRAPVFVSVPVDIDTILAGEPFPLLVDLIAVNENGSTEGVVITKEILDFKKNQCLGYPVTYKWTALDSCDNLSVITKSFFVKAVNEPPLFISEPLPITNVMGSDSFPIPEILAATNAAGFPADITISQTIDPYISNPCEPYAVTYRWIARDSCNNEATVTTSFAVHPDTIDFSAMPAMEDINLAIEVSCEKMAAIQSPIDISRYKNVSIDIVIYDEDWNIISTTPFEDDMEYSFEIGTSYLVYNIIDLCDRSMSDTIAINASDVSSPSIICLENQNLFVSDYSTCSTIANWLEPKVLDNCPDVEIHQTSGPLSGSSISTGHYTINYEATDQSGNTSTCTFDIVVAAVPITLFICEPIIVPLDTNCQATLSRSYILAQEQFSCSDSLGLIITASEDTLVGATIQLGDYYGTKITYTVCDPVTNLCCSNEIIIQDFSAPSIICQDPISVTCYDEIDSYRPTLKGECGTVTWRISEQALTTECEDKYTFSILTRTYIAIDSEGNESSACTQQFIIRFAQIDSLDHLGLIVFPQDSIIQCDNIDLENSEKTLVGIPTINGHAIHPDSTICGLDITYYDDDIISHGCERGIIRSWRIVEDLCHQGFNIVEGRQFIRVTDTIAPIITSNIDTITLFTEVKECHAYLYDPPISVTDNCQNIDDITINYTVGAYDYTQYQPMQIPLGITHVIISARDECGNVGYATLIVEVLDQIRPVAVCFEENVIALSSGLVNIYASSIDAGTYDNCELASVEIKREGDFCTPEDSIYSSSVHLCCDDVGREILVTLKATDYAGNINYCTGHVFVQDKLAPAITCPPDLVVACEAGVRKSDNEEDPYGYLFGQVLVDEQRKALGIDKKFILEANGTLIDGIAKDQCTEGLMIAVSTIADVNPCGIGVIKRTFIATDKAGNQSYPCTQTIVIVGGNEIDTSLIEWPASEVGLDACDSALDVSPESLGRPIIQEESCALYGVGYEDTYFDIVGDTKGICTKIIRRWNVINWCSPKDLVGISMWQTIKISDDIAPEIHESCDEMLYLTGFSTDCLHVPVSLTIEVTDNCTPSEALEVYVSVDSGRENRLTFDTLNGHLWSDTLVRGAHNIIWTVVDKCGNTTQCTQSIMIEDIKPPTPYAIGLITTISTEGFIEIWASDLAAKATDPCGLVAEILISRQNETFYDAQTNLRLDCNDLGVTYVKVYAFRRLSDGTFAYDYTIVTVDLQDNNGVCGNDVATEAALTSQLSGRIKTSYGVLLPFTEIVMTSQSSNHMMLTDEAGWYEENLLVDSMYLVRPQIEDIPIRGLSTRDAIMIQRHILGLTTFTSPWDQITADVTRDHRITAIDIIELRKVVIGRASKLDQYLPWTFLPEAYPFIDPQHAVEEDIDDRTYYVPEQGNKKIDFIGMKIGDVDKSISISNLAARSRSTLPLEIIYRHSNTSTMDTVLISLSQSIDLYGWQLGLEVAAHAHVLDHILIEDTDDYDYFIDRNTIKMSAQNTISKSKRKGSVLVKLVVKQGASINPNISINLISNQDFASELYDENLNTYPISVSFDPQQQSITQPIISPNPFNEYTNLVYHSESTIPVVLQIFTTQGLVIYRSEYKTKEGTNEMRINGADLSSSRGLLFYEIKQGSLIIRGKMIRL